MNVNFENKIVGSKKFAPCMRNGYIEVLFGLVDYRRSLRNVKSAVRRHLNDRSSFQDEDDSDGRMATNSS